MKKVLEGKFCGEDNFSEGSGFPARRSTSLTGDSDALNCRSPGRLKE